MNRRVAEKRGDPEDSKDGRGEIFSGRLEAEKTTTRTGMIEETHQGERKINSELAKQAVVRGRHKETQIKGKRYKGINWHATERAD